MDNDGNCQACTPGKFCPGGDTTSNPNNLELDCPEGLETTFAGAKSQAQCFTKPGYGRVSTKGSDGKVSVTGVLCPVATYNVGANTAGCQNCGPGLTTATNGSSSAAACREYSAVLVNSQYSAVLFNSGSAVCVAVVCLCMACTLQHKSSSIMARKLACTGGDA
jgi:hypothetical protein